MFDSDPQFAKYIFCEKKGYQINQDEVFLKSHISKVKYMVIPVNIYLNNSSVDTHTYE